MATLHDKAQELASQAAVLLSQGDSIAARSLYARAAELEVVALGDVPADRVRTQAILSVSVVSLLYKARQYDVAARWCHRFLADDTTLPHARHQLRELLEVVNDEQVLLKHGREYVGDEITISLRGGEIGSGTAPFDTAMDYQTGVRSWLYRVAEFQGNYPFRTKGPPPTAVVDALQARATQHAIGSYRYTLRLTRPAQMSMFNGLEKQDPAAVTGAVFAILDMVDRRDVAGLRNLVPSEDHRVGILKVLRTLVPDNRRVGEVGIIRARDGGTIETAGLFPETKDRIKHHLMAGRPDAAEGSPGGSQPDEVQGVLRALHLDKHWLVLHLDGGEVRMLNTVENMLDDVVGPLVNRRVTVRGTWTKRMKLIVSDVEPA